MELLDSAIVIIVLASLITEGYPTMIKCTTDGQLDKPGHVHCHFSEDIRTTRRNFNIVYYPFGNNYSADYAKSKQVLLCNWMSDSVQCSTKEGFDYQKDVGNTTTLNIAKVSDDHFGFYICQLVPDNNDEVAMCNFTKSLVDTSSGENTLPATADTSVIGIVVGVAVALAFVVFGVIIVIIFLRRRRRHLGRKKDVEPSEIPEEVSMLQKTPENGLHIIPEREEPVIAGEPNNYVQEDVVPQVNDFIEVNKPDIKPDNGLHSNSGSKESAPEVHQGNEASEPQVNKDAVDVVDASFGNPGSDQQQGTLTSATPSQQSTHEKDSVFNKGDVDRPPKLVGYHPLFEPQHVWLMDTPTLCNFLRAEDVKEKIVKQFEKKSAVGENFEFCDYKEKALKKKKVKESDVEYADQVLKKLKEIRDRQKQLDT